MASNRSVRRAQEPVTYTCALCDSEDGVRWYCNDCQENLCDRCKETHTRGRKTKNDDVVSIGKANRQGDKPVPEVCKLHPGKLCDMFCSDCNELICSICLSKNHKQHNWKPFEDELSVKKEHFKEHMTTLADKIANFKTETSKRHCVNKTFKDNIDTTRREVNSQRTKLKAEVDYIAEAVLAELASLEKEESLLYKKDIQRSEKNVEELTRLLEQAEMTDTSSVSIFETEMSLRKTLPLYDVKMKHVSPKQPSFVLGNINRILLTKMLGELHHGDQYEKTDIDSKHVQRLSKFTVSQQNQILDISPVDDSHAWLSIHEYQVLVLVNSEAVAKETVKLDFCPHKTNIVGTKAILMTIDPFSTFVYKLSLHNKQVTTFADIRPHKAYDISINERDEVFVNTNTAVIVVLNQTGTIVRKVTCGMKAWCITCLSSGDIAVSDYDNVSIITDRSGTTKYKWSGELNNGQQVGSRDIRNMSRDKYDRLFVPDYTNNQVYVLPRDSTQATCLLDQKRGVTKPTSVGVDTCGNVWIGCEDGTVHVMRL
ncbi:uncharacterized protein LOC110452761 [Mizuhopecten yessoensis]|uniref:Transcription intermediary factor 1-beta n=1 Tax=Mizuhopecten yessoensis TaxID=6573 RepID=A0A210QJB8_MIZYE|nr:uncharacterized protein LOC110452761 [Mizuhopecten yessoensis]OWF48691.1 Transcription intermediary factor 1-beta [Mizuhopecten yessoensis]